MAQTPRRTKIVATLGPATSEPEQIAALVDAGVDAARLNFSHGKHDEHRELARRVREAASRNGTRLALIADLQGPQAARRRAVRARLAPQEEITVVAEEAARTATFRSAPRRSARSSLPGTRC